MTSQITYLNSYDHFGYTRYLVGSGLDNFNKKCPIDFCIAPRQHDSRVKDTVPDRNIVDTQYETDLTTSWTVNGPINYFRNGGQCNLLISMWFDLYLYDKDKDYGFSTMTLNMSNSKIKNDGYYLTDGSKCKKFIVLDSDSYSDMNCVSKVYYLSQDSKIIRRDLQKPTIRMVKNVNQNRFPKSCVCMDPETGEIYNFVIYYRVDGESSSVSHYHYILTPNFSPTINISVNTPRNIHDDYNEIYLSTQYNLENLSKLYNLKGILVNTAIYNLFSTCGMMYNRTQIKNEDWTTEDNRFYSDYESSTKRFLNRFSLCILKLSTINAFCT